MRKQSIIWLFMMAAVAAIAAADVPELFITADRCMACHNGLITPQGKDASIGVNWRSSMMANSARDPYWQAAIRREALVHPTASAVIQNECGACHMPMHRFQANAEGEEGEVFAHLAQQALFGYVVEDQQSPQRDLVDQYRQVVPLNRTGVGLELAFACGLVAGLDS